MRLAQDGACVIVKVALRVLSPPCGADVVIYEMRAILVIVCQRFRVGPSFEEGHGSPKKFAPPAAVAKAFPKKVVAERCLSLLFSSA